MKLMKIYANKSLKVITFNEGLNLILAKVTNRRDLKKDSHNLGKTTLIAVIDFLLLKNTDRYHFFNVHKDKFSDIIFFLELQLNSGKYLTIKRGVDKPTRISFKEHSIRNQNLVNEASWDEVDLPIDKAREYLDRKMNFDILQHWDYRKSVTYFLRSQNDYRDVFQLNKFSKGKDVDWKPFIFDMLGFNGQLIIDKYDNEQHKAKQKDLISGFKNQLSVDPEEIDKIRGAIELKRDEKQTLEVQLNNFNFYHEEQELKRELIEEIEAEIAKLNSVDYNITYEIERINDSFKTQLNFDLNDVTQLFEEIQIVFPDKYLNGYEKLVEFNKLITEERSKYLNERLEYLTSELSGVKNILQDLDSRRSELLSIIKDKDSFRKYNQFRKDLGQIDSDIIRLEEKLNNINKIDVLHDSINAVNSKIEELVREIKGQIENNQSDYYSLIRKMFRDIIKAILDSPAILYMVINDSGNIEYKAEVQRDDEIEITSEGRGFSYKKFLCMAFDLSILVTYSNHSFFRFVYHDGALEGLDNRKKLNFIKQMRDICEKYKLQYIFTSIEDDLPRDEKNDIVAFADSEIALQLDDSGDSGKLFGFSF